MFWIGLLFLIGIIGYSISNKTSGKKIYLIDPNMITFYPCKPFDYELTSDGKVSANVYHDINGRIRYCCNPNHTHYYE